MRRSDKKWIIIFVIFLVVGIILIITSNGDGINLSVSEKKWIQDNKNDLIDLEIPSDIPALSRNGSGVIFDFLNSLEKDTNLEFNKLSYKKEDKPTSEYKIIKKENTNKNDLLLYADSYALVGKNKEFFTSSTKINGKTIGVLKNNLENTQKYLANPSLKYQSYDTVSSMIQDLKDSKVDYIVISKLENLDKILEENLYIVNNIYDYQENYVIELGNNSTLNKILRKYYKEYSNKLEPSFNKNLVNSYFDLEKISEKDQTEFRSKRYSYGFTNDVPFDYVTSDGLMGINYAIISSFANASNAQINFKKYNTISSLRKDFDNNKIDIMYDNGSNYKSKIQTYDMPSIYDEKVSAISKNKNINVDSIYSLKNEEVSTIKDSLISSELKKENIKVKEYDNINTLIDHTKGIILIDTKSYDYLIRGKLKNYNNLGTFELTGDYKFQNRSVKENSVLNKTLYFYLTFLNTQQMMNKAYKKVINYNKSAGTLRILLIIFVSLLCLIGLFYIIRYIKKHRKDPKKLSKADKLRYTDSLTSLKNRNYLNDSMNEWDNSEVYPKTVVIIDLNNVAYINDNFGHSEGDKVIVEAAGILINSQLPKSEIIRSNGNEFLVFMIGYDEKTVISYIRKINKELKTISHGFGAAVGYSMILDEVKTIDDAINEATSDMKKNKENR